MYNVIVWVVVYTLHVGMIWYSPVNWTFIGHILYYIKVDRGYY